jgi:hypothetical protein
VLHKTLVLSLVALFSIGLARAADEGESVDGSERGIGLFTFKVPRGWQDKSTPLLTVAVDEKHQIVFQAKVVKGAEAADAAMMDKYIADAERSLQKLVPNAQLAVKKKQRVTIAGMPAARFLFDMITAEGQTPVRTLQFYVPAAAIGQHAILTFTGPPTEFEQQVKLLDKIARATVVRPR